MEERPHWGHPFRSSLYKVRQARKHAAALEVAEAEYQAKEPVKWTWYEENFDDPKKPSFQIHIFYPSPEYSCIVGDVIHNLRAALDLMACDLVRAQGESADDVYFPFCDDASYIDTMIKRRHFFRAGPNAVAVLKTLAPYKGGNAALRAIHDLDIRDKHQTLIPVFASGITPTATIGEWPNGSLRLIYDTSEKPAPVGLRFPPEYALGDHEIIPTLHKLVELVEGIIETFAALIPNGQAGPE